MLTPEPSSANRTGYYVKLHQRAHPGNGRLRTLHCTYSLAADNSENLLLKIFAIICSGLLCRVAAVSAS